MQTLKKEVYISENHQLKVKVPNSIPVGKTEVLLVFQTVAKNGIIEPIVNQKNELDNIISSIKKDLPKDFHKKTYDELLFESLKGRI